MGKKHRMNKERTPGSNLPEHKLSAATIILCPNNYLFVCQLRMTKEVNFTQE